MPPPVQWACAATQSIIGGPDVQTRGRNAVRLHPVFRALVGRRMAAGRSPPSRRRSGLERQRVSLAQHLPDGCALRRVAATDAAPRGRAHAPGRPCRDRGTGGPRRRRFPRRRSGRRRTHPHDRRRTDVALMCFAANGWNGWASGALAISSPSARRVCRSISSSGTGQEMVCRAIGYIEAARGLRLHAAAR
jgi:hypothetical protein